MTERQTLGDATDFLRGITFKPEELIAPDDEDAVVCMRTKNVQQDLDASDLIAVPSRLVRNPDKYLRSGDILISSANSWELVGKCSYVGELDYPATAGGFISIVRAKPKTHTRFLYHWLNSPVMQHTIRNLGRQTTNISNLDVNRFKQLEFPEIDFEEQGRIASILDKADAIRRKRAVALSLAEDLLKSAFLEIFGDPLTNPLGFAREPISKHLSNTRPGTQSGPFGSSLKKHEYVESGIPVWGVENVQPGRFVDEASLFITEEKFSDLKRYSVEYGDILISRAGTVGRMCIATPSASTSLISTNLVRVALSEQSLLPQYFVSLFTYLPHRLGALKANNKQDAFTFLNPNTLKALEIPIPDLPRQKVFRDLVKKIESHQLLMQVQHASSEGLFASLSHRAFRDER